MRRRRHPTLTAVCIMRGMGDGQVQGVRGDIEALRYQAAKIAEGLRAAESDWRCSWTPADVLALHVAAGSVRPGGLLVEVGSGFSTGILASSLPHETCRMMSFDVDERACERARIALSTVGAQCEVVLGNAFLAGLKPGTADVLHVDGEHGRAFALGCIRHLWPIVRCGGQVIVHDMHDLPRSRGEFETVMGEVWGRGWQYKRTAFEPAGIDGWNEIPLAGPTTRNCILDVCAVDMRGLPV